MKIPAAWLIEKCGWKGKFEGEIGVHKNHALVLVNSGNGNGEEVKLFANKIVTSVSERFNIILEPEITII